MDEEIITYKKHPNIHKWLSKYIWYYNENKYHKFTLTKDNEINHPCNLDLRVNVTQIKYPFGYVKGDFDCDGCENLTSLIGAPKEVGFSFNCSSCDSLTSLIGAPIKIGGGFICRNCKNLKSLIGFPKCVKGVIYLDYNNFSNNPGDKQRYNKYIDMWFELLESVSDDEKIEYINNYKDEFDNPYNEPIIPKEIINQYKIDFLLKDI